MIKHTLMALSRAGTQADVDIVREHYQEDWWLQALLDRDAFHGLWHRQFFSHNYEITAFEAFLDMYVLTGNTTYLDAMLNAWSMLRQHWILPSGSIALNEGNYYPPDSLYIGFSGRDIASHHWVGHDHSHDHDHDHSLLRDAAVATPVQASADPYYHAPCMPGPLQQDVERSDSPYLSPLQVLKSAAMQPGRPPADDPGANPNDDDPPTGELCGSVFWTAFNQRFHRLFPDNETFVAGAWALHCRLGFLLLCGLVPVYHAAARRGY